MIATTHIFTLYWTLLLSLQRFVLFGSQANFLEEFIKGLGLQYTPNKIIFHHYIMDQPFRGFQLNQEMGLFTFYKMQQPTPTTQKLSSPNIPQLTKTRLTPITKNIARDHQDIQAAIKRRVQSVVDCQMECGQGINKKVMSRNVNLHKKKFSETESQQKHSIIDFSFDFSPKKRKNAGKQLFQSTVSHRLKTTNHGSTQEDYQLFNIQESKYFHSVNLMKINQIKKEEMSQLFKTEKEKHYQKMLKIKHKTEIQKPMLLSMQQSEAQGSNNSLSELYFMKKTKKDKPQPLNFLQYLEQKKKKMSEEYKKVRLNKKIGEILKIKVNQQSPIKLKRVGFDKRQLSYMISSVKYPIYQ